MAQATIGALRVILGADTAAFEKGMNEVERSIKKAQRSIQRIGKKMQRTGAIISASVTAPMLALGKTSFDAAVKHREAVAQIEAGLKSMGDASGKTAAQLKKSALQLEGLSTFNADDIMTKVTANMLTFGEISGEAFDRAQMAALDLSTRLDQDLKSSTILIGKALNDPITGLSALSRVGVKLSEDQEELAKKLAETGDIAGAQNIILKELERQYAGSAKAARDAAPGSDLIDQWRKMQRVVGELVMKFLPPLIDGLQKVLLWFNNLDPGMQNTIAVIGAVTAAIGPLIVILGTLVGSIGPLISALVVVGSKLGVAGLAGFMTGLLGPVGLVIAILIGAGGLVYALNQTFSATAKYNKSISETRKLIKGYETAQEEIRTDTILLKEKTEELNTAMRDSGEAAQDAARLEIDAINRRIQKNQDLAKVYLADLQLKKQVLAAEAAAANDQGLARVGGEVLHRSRASVKRRIKDQEGFRKIVEDTIQAELEGLRKKLDEGKVLTKFERERFMKLNDFETERIERAEELKRVTEQINAIQSPAETSTSTLPPLPESKPAASVITVPTKEETKAIEKRIARSKELVAASEQEIKNNQDLVEALKVSQREYEIVAQMQQLVAGGYQGTKEALRQLAEQMVMSNQSVEDAQEVWQSMEEWRAKAQEGARQLAEAHTSTVESIEKEIETNRLLTEALRVSDHEYRVVAETLKILEGGFLGGEAAARKMAEELVKTQENMKKAGDEARKMGDKMEAGFQKGVDGLNSLISAFKSGDIGGIIQSLGQLFSGEGGSFGGKGSGFANLFASFGKIFGGFRAAGGPVSAGKAYIVGEQGPEWFTSGTSGQIIPNLGGQTQVVIHPSRFFEVTVDGRAAKVARPIAQAQTTIGIGQARRAASMSQGRRLA